MQVTNPQRISSAIYVILQSRYAFSTYSGGTLTPGIYYWWVRPLQPVILSPTQLDFSIGVFSVPLGVTYDPPADNAEKSNLANLDAVTVEGLSSSSFTNCFINFILKLTGKSI